MCADPSHCPLRRHAQPTAWADDLDAQMRARLADAGGLTTAAELKSHGLSARQLARWISEGRLRAIPSGTEQWIPLFQLNAARRGLRGDVAAVADELEGALDAQDILSWFICPNASLGDSTPLAQLPHQLHAVLQAARLDRFLASA